MHQHGWRRRVSSAKGSEAERVYHTVLGQVEGRSVSNDHSAAQSEETTYVSHMARTRRRASTTFRTLVELVVVSVWKAQGLQVREIEKVDRKSKRLEAQADDTCKADDGAAKVGRRVPSLSVLGCARWAATEQVAQTLCEFLSKKGYFYASQGHEL